MRLTESRKDRSRPELPFDSAMAPLAESFESLVRNGRPRCFGFYHPHRGWSTGQGDCVAWEFCPRSSSAHEAHHHEISIAETSASVACSTDRKSTRLNS